MNCCPRSRLDRQFPDLSERVAKHHAKQAEQHDTSKPLRTFAVGDTVYVEDFSTPSPTWIPGMVTKVTGPLSYHVELESGLSQFDDMWMQCAGEMFSFQLLEILHRTPLMTSTFLIYLLLVLTLLLTLLPNPLPSPLSFLYHPCLTLAGVGERIHPLLVIPTITALHRTECDDQLWSQRGEVW